MSLNFNPRTLLDDAGFLESFRSQSHNASGPAVTSASQRGKPAIAATTHQVSDVLRQNPFVKPGGISLEIQNQIGSADVGYFIKTEGGVDNTIGQRKKLLGYDILLKDGVDDGRFSKISSSEETEGSKQGEDAVPKDEEYTNTAGGGQVSGDGKVFPVARPYDYADTWGASRATTGTHKGVDIFTDGGHNSLFAISDGTIVRAGWGDVPGNRVQLHVPEENITWFYAHMHEISVSEGQTVSKGDVLGTAGDTGDAQGTPIHLHLGVSTGSSFTEGEGVFNPYSTLKAIEWAAVRAAAEGSGAYPT